jgi:N-acetylglucosamine malate deacetylase 1
MPPELPPLLAFGAHPDDLEFGCGGVIARESHAGRQVHLVVCSRGEAGTRGTPVLRTKEAKKSAHLLGASVEFIDLGGDAHFELKLAHVLQLARLIRRWAPGLVLAPSVVENQHPDHAKLGQMVRDAARLARFGGLKELRGISPHSIGGLLFYAITADAEPTDLARILIDVSAPEIMAAWIAAMEAHASQMPVQPYRELQLVRARLCGLRAGVDHAIPLFPADPLVFASLAPIVRSARKF